MVKQPASEPLRILNYSAGTLTQKPTEIDRKWNGLYSLANQWERAGLGLKMATYHVFSAPKRTLIQSNIHYKMVFLLRVSLKTPFVCILIEPDTIGTLWFVVWIDKLKYNRL